MKRLLVVLIFLVSFNGLMYADVLTDKAMRKISRDTRTYISGESRAATEQDAYDQAMESLSSQISKYMKEKYGETPDAVYLTELSSLYQRLDNRIAENRYRVMIYVKKSDIKPMGSISNAVVLTKNENDTYEAISPTDVKQIVVKDTVTVVDVVEVPLDPTISLLIQHTSKSTFIQALTNLSNENKIGNAAKFPLSDFEDFYVAIIDSFDNVVLYAHVVNGKWLNVANGIEITPNEYKQYSAYWFTLPK